MRVGRAKELFRSLTKKYFNKAEVAFANQGGIPEQKNVLVLITPGNVKRPLYPNYETVDGVRVGNYLSRLSITVDLFTNGAPVVDEETGQTVAREDNAEEELLAFVDFLNSEYAVDWCRQNDVSVLIDEDVTSLTGLVNDVTYQYRARITAQFYFTQKAIGHAGILSEDSIQYFSGEVDPETGEPIYTPVAPEETESSMGNWNATENERPGHSETTNPGDGEATNPGDGEVASPGDGEATNPGNDETVHPGDSEAVKPDDGVAVKPMGSVIIKPTFKPTAGGGGTEELANLEIGYFTKVEITEEKPD